MAQSGGPLRPYYSERSGRRARVTLTPEQLRRGFASIVQVCEGSGQLQEWFGYECVDDGDVPGKLGTAIEERLMIVLGREHLWPVAAHVQEWDDDALLDMVEFLHDHVSSPVEGTGRYHSYANCGMHWGSFTPEPARSEYRVQVNELLQRADPAYVMNEQGEVLRAVPDGVAPLLTSAPRLLGARDGADVEAAITKYRSRSSSPTDRRDAVRDLADVLEHLRASVKETMPRHDEAMLFEIANKFWIRHNKPDERRDYDHDAWWSWLFYVYLASIALVTHLTERKGDQPNERGGDTNAATS